MTTRAHIPAWLATAVALVLLVFVAADARAEGDDQGSKADRPDYVSQLTAEELEQLRQRLPRAWDDYSADEQQRIAKGVLRLRDMTPEQRAALEDKIRRYREAKRQDPDLRSKLEARFDEARDRRPREREMFRRLHALAKGSSMVLFETLDETQKKQFQRFGVGQHQLAMPFFRCLVEEAVKPYAEGEEMDLSALPEDAQRSIRAALESGGEKARARVARMYVTTIALKAFDAVPKPLATDKREQSPAGSDKPKGIAVREYYRSLGKAVAALWPEAFEQATGRIAALQSAEDAWAFVERFGGPESREGRDAGRILALVRTLLDAPTLAKTREERLEVNRLSNGLLRYVLVRKAGLEESAVDAALAHDAPGVRKAAVFRLLRAKGLGMKGPRGRRPGRNDEKDKDGDG